MAISVSNLTHLHAGREYLKIFDVTFDSSYPTGGEALDLSTIGLSTRVTQFTAPNTGGYAFDYNRTDDKILVYRAPGASPTFTGTAPAGVTINFTDSDSAAATGVAVYAHVDEVLEDGSIFAHLEFVSPTNADGTGTLSNGGPTFQIIDDDLAATGGFQVYLDEDATAGSRLLANVGADCYVTTSTGDLIKITHNATPATPGVAVYFDEDAANSYQRLLFVSPTNANGTDTTSATVTLREGTPAGTISTIAEAAFGEVDNATDLSSLTVRCSVVGV